MHYKILISFTMKFPKIFEIKTSKRYFFVASLSSILSDGALYKFYGTSGRFDGYCFYLKRRKLNIVKQSNYLTFMRKMIALNPIPDDENKFSGMYDIIQYLFQNNKPLEVHLFKGQFLYGFILSYDTEQIKMKALYFNGSVYKDNVNISVSNIKELFFGSPGLEKYEFLLQEDVIDDLKETPVIYSKQPLIKLHTLCSIFFKSRYCFEVGYINGIDDGKVIMDLFDEEGFYDGVLIRDLAEVSKISYRGKYLKMMDKLINIHHSKAKMLNKNDFNGIMKYCLENQITVNISTKNRKQFDYAIIKEINSSDLLCAHYDGFAHYIGERKYPLKDINYLCFGDELTKNFNQIINTKDVLTK